jgi:mannonate dehydratase
MARRNMLKMAALGAAAVKFLPAQPAKGVPSPKIKDIQVIACSPNGLRLITVKVITDQDGLYGYGCATFTQRAEVVIPAIEKYLKPLLIGQKADRIEDIWNLAYTSSYWRNSGVLNNAISGVDMALWDIKGRMAGMPVYQLLGGKVREAAAVYRHAAGAEIPDVVEQAKKLISEGVRHVRVQVGLAGQASYGGGPGMKGYEDALKKRTLVELGSAGVFEPKQYIRKTLKLLEACRTELGEEVELLHDVHERIHPTDAVQMCKDVEKFKLFFFEDPVSPEDLGYFRAIRQQCATPIAMGELFNSPNEWTPLIKDQLIDFIRIHVSQAGGLSPCRKIAAACEMMGVRTAWHGPGDMTPIAHAANIALDLTVPNFGIQEFTTFNERTQEVFEGCPKLENGYAYANEKPGWGIEVNEKAAAKYPFGTNESGERKKYNGGWGPVRKLDGTIIKQ